MIDEIKKILSENKEVSAWKISYSAVESEELFFIKKSLDMNRGKKVSHLLLTVYNDFQEEDIKYRGSSTIEIHPTMKYDEIENKINKAVFAAGFVKNKYYPLVEPGKEKYMSKKYKFDEKPLEAWIPELTDSIYKADKYDKGHLNSAELFLSKCSKRILNSNGVDVEFNSYKGEMEFVVNWKEESEEIELYKNLSFSDYDPELITEKVDEMLRISRDKAIAKNTPALKKSTVLLTGKPVCEFFKYYYSQANAQAIYNKTSVLKIGENVQGEDVKGDTINITLDPEAENSIFSAPYDNDGYRLSKFSLYKDGILQGYWGDIKNSYYLGVNPTGIIQNMCVKGGARSIDSFKTEPYLEVIAFSDFQMDNVTGDFGGEIRLGWYFDGKTTTPVSGGSISGNVREVHNNMHLSKEIQKEGEFEVPKTIQLFNVTVAGI